MDLDFNLILFLVKFLKMAPESASRSVYFKQYCLHHSVKNCILQQPGAIRQISNGDTVDLVKCSTLKNLDEVWDKMEPQTYIQNPFGGFHVEFLNRYINDYLMCPVGKS